MGWAVVIGTGMVPPLVVACGRRGRSGAARAGRFRYRRGDDTRTRHLDVLLKAAAAADPAHVFYINPPADFCTNHAIATDVYYRWDGVHYGFKGAALVFKTITPQLLAIPGPDGGGARLGPVDSPSTRMTRLDPASGASTLHEVNVPDRQMPARVAFLHLVPDSGNSRGVLVKVLHLMP